MFDIGWSEMAVIMLIALIVIGPKDLPKVARTIGRWVGKGRAMAREFQRAIEDMAKETELDTVKKEIEKVGSTNFGRTIEKTVDPTGELSKAFDPKADTGKAAAGKAPAKPIPPAKTSTSAPAKTSTPVETAAGGTAATAAPSSDAAEVPAPAASPVPSPTPNPVVAPAAEPPDRATVSAEPN